ncbi:hypothetical protein SuNHUV7_00150 (plasmid) [Pseudoseohaeicola sp. NH-UV-7]|uniref:helix-turn-helix transcriptional regulator n=1 Tax=Sulfitobacter sp. TBRI5 TaxID=2989732 RepID=UPI003A6FD05E
MTKKLLTTDEKIAEIGVSRQTLYRWRKMGIGPKYLEYGGCIRYLPEPLLAEHVGEMRVVKP